LSLKQDRVSKANRKEIFCLEYIIDFNATRAAIASGYSKKTARSQGNRLLTNVDIQRRLAELIKKRSSKVELTAENVLIELSRLAFSNPKDFVKKGDEDFVIFKNIDDIPDELAAAIESIKYDKDKGIEFKFHNKEKALELCLRHLGLLSDNLNLRGAFTHTHDVNMNKLRKAINAIRGKGNKRKP